MKSKYLFIFWISVKKEQMPIKSFFAPTTIWPRGHFFVKKFNLPVSPVNVIRLRWNYYQSTGNQKFYNTRCTKCTWHAPSAPSAQNTSFFFKYLFFVLKTPKHHHQRRHHPPSPTYTSPMLHQVHQRYTKCPPSLHQVPKIELFIIGALGAI